MTGLNQPDLTGSRYARGAPVVPETNQFRRTLSSHAQVLESQRIRTKDPRLTKSFPYLSKSDFVLALAVLEITQNRGRG